MAGAPEGSRLAPPLAGSARIAGHRDYVIKVLLHGLTGPLGEREYPGGVMVPMGTNTDQWISDVANYVRNSFGNSGMFITPAQVAFVRGRAARKTSWTLPELEGSLPRLMTNAAEWRLSASHNSEAAANATGAVPFGRWDTAGAAEQPGMWFQIELPQPAAVTEVQIDTSAPSTVGRGRGGPGRGAAPVPGAQGQRAGAPATAPAAPPAASRGGGRGRGGPQVPIAGPVAYNVQLSLDGTTWSAPVAQGEGAATTVMQFAPSDAKFIRITQTGTAANGEQWAIAQVRVYTGIR